MSPMEESCRLVQLCQGSAYTWMRQMPFQAHKRHKHQADRRSGPSNHRHAEMMRKSAAICGAVSQIAQVEHARTEAGEVLYVGAGVAVVDELDNDAPIGTLVTFGNGSSGALMWRRDDNLCYILLLDGYPEQGDLATCSTTNQPQEIDSEEARNKRDFRQAEIPVGDSLFGQCTTFQGQHNSREGSSSSGQLLPLLNQQVPVDDREQILEALPLGIKAVDILTPIGRGQAQLVTGQASSGKTSLVLDSILGQRDSDLKCIYASVGASAAESQQRWTYLRENAASESTQMIIAADSASLGERYAALCAACSRGEAIRDSGGHSLVILDDISSMVAMWEHITEVVQRLRPDPSPSNGSSVESEEDLVQYEGMLISAAAAQRRRFFSLLVQRAAKMHRRKGGGTMTLLLVLAGQPATGILKKAPDMSKYKHLSPELRAKLEAKLTAEQGNGTDTANWAEENVRTEVVEEFMSMADGQTVLVKPSSSSDTQQGIRIDASASVSRIGGRAYAPAIRELAKSARLDLVQAADAQQFSSNLSEEETAKADRRAKQLNAALQQNPGQPVSIQKQVAALQALQLPAFSETVQEGEVSHVLDRYLQRVEEDHPDLLQDIARSNCLSAATTDVLRQVLKLVLEERC